MKGLLQLLSALPLAVMAWKMWRMFGRFREAGAIAPESARLLGELNLEPSRTLARLQRRGLIRELPDGRYYLDEVAYERWDRRRRLILVVVLSLIAVVLVFVLR
jgi:hypothetical protein